MKRYFFDVVGEGCTEIDFHGRAFTEPQKALETAQILALDIEVGYGEEDSGSALRACSRSRSASPTRLRPDANGRRRAASQRRRQVLKHAGSHALPIAGPRLTEKPRRRVPGAALTRGGPAPIGR